MNTGPGWAHRHSQPCGAGAIRGAGTPPGGWRLLPSAGGAEGEVGREPALRGNQGSREAELLQGRTGVRTEHSQDGAWLSLPRERGCGEGEGMGPGDTGPGISQHPKAYCLHVGAKKVPCVWTLLNMSLTERKAVLTKQTGCQERLAEGVTAEWHKTRPSRVGMGLCLGPGLIETPGPGTKVGRGLPDAGVARRCEGSWGGEGALEGSS